MPFFFNITFIWIVLRYLKVPEAFDFIGVVDLFFKIHKIFQLKFHDYLKTAMQFLERFIYEISIDDAFITDKMRDLALDKSLN